MKSKTDGTLIRPYSRRYGSGTMDTAQRDAESDGDTKDTPQDQSRTAKTPSDTAPALQWPKLADMQKCGCATAVRAQGS